MTILFPATFDILTNASNCVPRIEILLIDEIDTKEVKNQAAKYVVCKCPETLLASSCLACEGSLPFWRY